MLWHPRLVSALLYTLLLAAPALGTSPRAARAQGAGPREVANNTNAWLAYFGDHALGKRWAFLPDLQVRRGDAGATWQQLLVRPGLAYRLTDGARVAVGYAFVDTWPYGDQPALRRFPEHRTWQQLALTHATGRVSWQHRYRLEQRWVEVPVDAASGDWRYTNRVRYMARLNVPLRGATLDVGEPYLGAYDELFVNWGRNVGRNTFDQNRAAALLGWRVGQATRVEGGYLQQLVAKADGVRLERNHTILLSLVQNAPLRR